MNEKQIEKKAVEEMARVMCDDCRTRDTYPCKVKICDAVLQNAEALYNAGYRKQSDNIVEVVRYKDCRWFQRENWDGEILYGCDCSSGMNDISPDDYCSCGEPKMKGGE